MNKSEYRKVINDALSSRKVSRPGIGDMLEQKGINKGNFYAFLRGTDKAMSLENLQIIYRRWLPLACFRQTEPGLNPLIIRRWRNLLK